MRRVGGVLEDRGGRTIRIDRREGKMASPLLGCRNDLGEPRVQIPPTRRRQAHGDGRSEQRMGESEALSVRLDDACRESLGQPGLVTVPDDGLHEGHRRIGERCNGGGDVESLGSKRVETHVQQLVEGGRDGEILAGVERAASALQDGSELEREERIAPRRLPELDQHRPRERRVEAVAQQLVRRAKAQAPDMDCS